MIEPDLPEIVNNIVKSPFEVYHLLGKGRSEPYIEKPFSDLSWENGTELQKRKTLYPGMQCGHEGAEYTNSLKIVNVVKKKSHLTIIEELC